MILKPGQTLGDTYTIRFFIGEGAFGEVYRVNHRYLGTQVLKIFKPSYLQEADIETLTREARILAGISHENVVRVFDTNSCIHEGVEQFFLTMGFVSGESLGQMLKREQILPVDLALSIQSDILKGLHAIQDRGLVHRDIYPNNVLLSYNTSPPRALLSDFGLALPLISDFAIQAGGGNYFYSAPECSLGVVLPCSDVFSAGLVLYEMLTGQMPWLGRGEDIFTTSRDLRSSVRRSRRGKPIHILSLRHDLPPKLADIVDRALALKIEDRYQTAVDFLTDLESV